MVDVHCHLADSRFEKETERVVEKMKIGGVTAISCGTSLEGSTKTVEIAQRFSSVWACVGIHPEEIQNSNNKFTNQSLRGQIQILKNLINNPKVVGIGEIGLDYRAETSNRDREEQRKLFEVQLRLAAELKLPVQVHNRGADEDIWNLINKYRVTGVMHCFTRSLDFMRRCAGAGWMLSFGGLLTYENNERMRRVLKETPEGKLLLETDSPYSVPKPLSGEINTPANIWTIAETVAKLREISVSQADKITTNNAVRCFNIQV